MEIERCKMKQGKEQISKNGCWTLLFELVRQLMPCRTRDWRDTSLVNSSVLERLRLPIMPKDVRQKANETSFTSLELFSKSFERARFGYA